MQNYNLLKEALEEIKLEEISSLPEENEIDHQFSVGFLKKMKRLISKQKKSTASKFNKISKFAAVLVLIILMCAISAMTVKTDAFHRIFDFIYSIYENFLVIENEVLYVDETELTVYTLAEIPEGYEEQSLKKLIDSYTFHWSNPLNENIRFQATLSSNYYKINTKGYTTEKTIINSVNVLYCNNSETIYCFWEDDLYKYHLSYPACLGKEFAEKNIGKLKEREN